MDLQLLDKIVIVTGGAKGIGEAPISRNLAAEGVIPVIVGRSQTDNEKLVAEIQAAGGRAAQVVAELTVPDDCRKAIDIVVQQFGGISMDLVNNAGVNDGVGPGEWEL